MTDQSLTKKCAICGEVVDQGLLQCPSCGKGTFESQKAHWYHPRSAKDLVVEPDSANTDVTESILMRLVNYIASPFTRTLIQGRTGYFYQPITSPAFCSDNQCPCNNTPIQEGEGFLYISKEAVEFRRNARSEKQLQAKAAKYIESIGAGNRTAVFLDPPMYKAVLICEVAARQRGLDLETAAADAIYAWKTSKAPLRATPHN